MSTYDDASLAMRFRALATDPLPVSWDEVLEVADTFERIFPVPTVADWNIRDRAEAHRPDRRTWLPSRRAIAIAAMIVVAGLLVAPAVAVGDHILELIYGKSDAGRRADTSVVARRPEARVRERTRRQRRDLRDERRRQRAGEPDPAAGERQPSQLVARRTEARVRQPPRRQRRDLRHERRRERAAQRDADSVGRSRSCLVT